MQKRCQWRTNGYVRMQTTKRLLKLCSKLLLSLYSPYESCSTSAQCQLRIKILGTHSYLLILSIPPTMGKQGFTNYLLNIFPHILIYHVHLQKRPCVCKISKEKKNTLHFFSTAFMFQNGKETIPFISLCPWEEIKERGGWCDAHITRIQTTRGVLTGWGEKNVSSLAALEHPCFHPDSQGCWIREIQEEKMKSFFSSPII